MYIFDFLTKPKCDTKVYLITFVGILLQGSLKHQSLPVYVKGQVLPEKKASGTSKNLFIFQPSQFDIESFHHGEPCTSKLMRGLSPSLYVCVSVCVDNVLFNYLLSFT